MAAWIIWLIIAVSLIIVEVLSQMVWTLCLSAGCICAGIAAMSGAGIPWQIAFMAIGAVVAFPILMPWLRRWHKKKGGNHDARTGMDALLGRRGTVTSDICPGKLGRIRIDGDNWQARANGPDTTIAQGSEVVVTAYDSIILTVEEFSKKQ